MIEPGLQAERTEDEAPAGWYPDMADSGLMRYWDGYHFTGQTMPVEPLEGEWAATPKMTTPGSTVSHGDRASSVTGQEPGRPRVAQLADEFLSPAGETKKGGPPAAGMTTLRGVVPSQEPPVKESDTWTALRGVGEVSTESDEDESGPRPIGEVAKRADSERARPSAGHVAPPSARADRVEGDQSSDWAQKAERAVARAQEVGTPDAWREVAATAAVVEELAQTMVVATTAAQTSEEAGKAAEKAEEEATAAALEATEAEQSAQRAASAAQQAQAASTAAAADAARARHTAEQTAQAAPRIAEAARVAAQAAEDALHKSRGIEAIVARALAVNTPAAWSEADESAAEAME
jgi:hypothetical protein